MTKVFSHGGAEVTHPEKGTFTVTTQRLKPYFGGEFHTDKQIIPLTESDEVQQAVIRARVPEHIEIQGRRANDIKHSTSWEATQVFLQFSFLWFKFLLSVLSYVGLMFLSVIRVPFWMFTFRTCNRRYWGGSVHPEHYKRPESHNYTRGVFSYLRPWLHKCTFWAFPITSRRWISTSRRQFDPSLKRRNVDFTLLCNVATLDFNVATLVWNPTGTSRRWIPTSRR